MRHTEHPWKHATLGDYVDIQTGFPFKSQYYTDDPSGIRLLRGDNIVQGKLRWDGVKRWESDDNESFEKYSLRTDDIVLAMDRPWIEAGLKYAWITEHDLPCLLVQRVSRLRGINGLLTRYIRYVIGHHSFTDYLKGIWTGVAVPHISESQIRAFHFLLPPTGIQERILSILSAYDDLIENNTRRIRILEEMAQMIYREWFVNLRFPGHEKVKMVESEMGQIPEGWLVRKFGEIVEIRKGKKAKTVIDLCDIGFVSYLLIDTIKGVRQQYANPDGMVLADTDDTLMVMDGASSGRVMIGVAGAVGSTIARFRPIDRKSFSPFLLFLLLKDREQEVGSKNVGAAIPHANKDYINGLPVVLCSRPINQSFETLCEPLFGLIKNLKSKNLNLRYTRDLLLPKLISGEVSVGNLEAAPTA